MTAQEYQAFCDELERRSEGDRYGLPILANAAAILYNGMDSVNWAGFYLLDGETLHLGPFQGKPAVSRIALGAGVCGTAALTKQVQRVKNVHCFAGHIACDCASNAEIVLPVFVNGRLFGVLDMDSPELSRFTEEDQKGLEMFVGCLERLLKDRSFYA